MNSIRRRIATLEVSCPAPEASLALDLPPDLAQRILDARAAGSFPAGLSRLDLLAILAAWDEARHAAMSRNQCAEPGRSQSRRCERIINQYSRF